MKQSRRKFFRNASLAVLASTATVRAQLPKDEANATYKAREDGPINHSVMGWCFKPMKAPELAKHCAEIGLKGMEGIGKGDYPAVKELGLEISLVSGG